MTVVTFDVFSALTNSRLGGSTFLDSLSASRGWPVSGVELYDRWDALNKERHRATVHWVPFAELSALALESAFAEFALPWDDAPELSSALLESMVDWPLWPDVSASSLEALGATGLGLLSNIDDALLAGTAAVRLGVFDPDFIITSQRARAYKPSPALYGYATELLGDFVHVASSARDVRGSLDAGISVIRLVRPGHRLDPDGPTPSATAERISEVGEILRGE
jgi:2-haloacid dehalogenase